MKTIRGRRVRRGAAAAIAAALALLVPAAAPAHIERASYWPDPGVDYADGQPVGGAVPETRSLASALDEQPVGDTIVVCKGSAVPLPKRQKGAEYKAWQRAVSANPSMQALDDSLANAVANGYVVRPSEPRVRVTEEEAGRLRDLNTRLLAQCRFNQIQAAVNAAGNNDRVVVMPGIYDEPTSRAAPTHDPACDGLEEENDRGQTGALSYRYQATCPNDQNLIAIIGREPGADPPQPPAWDRHGIPDNGPCIRCNLQLEGSGPSPDDVVVDAGRVASGNGAPADPVKDIAIRAERADGIVIRNLTARHAAEHGIYVVETDGQRLERFKAFHNEEYGVLTFTADHALVQDCEAAGSGDAGLYPGSAADTGEQRRLDVNPQARLGNEYRECDMHHNTIGYSGTAANAVHVHDNDFYDNALGLSTDVFTAAGHPGFPQDSDLIENNDFYSNNFNPYAPGSDVVPTVPVPVGTGLWIAGGNNNTVRDNRFWDNWRRGAMLFAVPDAFVCGPGPTAGGNEQAGCDETQVSTSYRNRFHGNRMGRDPSGSPDPNGEDFWWDQFPGNTDNCWYDNVGSDGTRGSLTSTPPLSPVAGTSIPGFLPEDCATSVGTSGAPQDAELLSCLAAFSEDAPTPCTWFETPTEPRP